MKIQVVNSTNTNYIEIGTTDGYYAKPVPRVGERINLGYLPVPQVDSVVYDYENKIVYVHIDSPFLKE